MRANADATKKVLDRLLEEGIKPHADELARIAMDSRAVAIVVFEPDPMVIAPLRVLGWDGTSAVFRMRDDSRKRMAADLARCGDPVSAAWLRRTRAGRMFVFIHAGTLLVNFRPREGYSIEPGSLDADRVN